MHWNRKPTKGDEQHSKILLCDIFINIEITESKNYLSTVLVLVAFSVAEAVKR